MATPPSCTITVPLAEQGPKWVLLGLMFVASCGTDILAGFLVIRWYLPSSDISERRILRTSGILLQVLWPATLVTFLTAICVLVLLAPYNVWEPTIIFAIILVVAAMELMGKALKLAERHQGRVTGQISSSQMECNKTKMTVELLVWAIFPASVVARIVVAITILWGMTSNQVGFAATVQLILLTTMTMNVYVLFSCSILLNEGGGAMLYLGGGILEIIFIACEMVLLILLRWEIDTTTKAWQLCFCVVAFLPGYVLSIIAWIAQTNVQMRRN